MRPNHQPLLRLVAVNGAFGAVLGLLATAALVGGDVLGLHRLAVQDPDAGLGLALLAAGLMGLCAAACIATAIMLLGPDEAGEPRGPGTPVLVPVPVRLRRRRG
jgi:hypothetical protein